jgi:hypothetical protein
MSHMGEYLQADRSFVPQRHALWGWNHFKHQKPQKFKKP